MCTCHRAGWGILPSHPAMSDASARQDRSVKCQQTDTWVMCAQCALFPDVGQSVYNEGLQYAPQSFGSGAPGIGECTSGERITSP